MLFYLQYQYIGIYLSRVFLQDHNGASTYTEETIKRGLIYDNIVDMYFC